MAEYELEAISALFAKLAARIGLDIAHPASEVAMRAALSDLIDEDAEAAELARTLIALKAVVRADGPEPGRPYSLGEEEDPADGEALYGVIEICRSVAGRAHSLSAPTRLLREAIRLIWEQPRLPRPLIQSRYPAPYPWSPAARALLAKHADRPAGGWGLALEHLYPLELLAADLLDESNESVATTVELLSQRITTAVVTSQEGRLLPRFAGMTWDAFEADPWCRYRAVLAVDDFAPLDAPPAV